MAEKAITIYTPASSEPHITAADDAFIHHAILRETSGILGSLQCRRVDDNTVRLSGGGVSNMGYILYIPEGQTHDLTVTTGTAGLGRHDIVVAEFVKGGGSTADSHTFKVIKGVAAETPEDPVLRGDSLSQAGDVRQIALFRVVLNGTVITEVTALAGRAADVSVATSCTGNAASASKLSGARVITFVGDVSGSMSFDGSGDLCVTLFGLNSQKVRGQSIFVQDTQPVSPQINDLWFW